MWTRRSMIGGALALAAAPAEARLRTGAVEHALAELRARIGGRLGVAALDSGSGQWLRLDAHRRYAMASTFKLPLAAAVLAGVDAGRLRLEQPVAFSEADILDYAPVVRAHAAERQLALGTLAEAAVVASDNSAANLLLPLVGGPAGLTRFMRAHGGGATRLDRTEPTLNANEPRDPRDTTTPADMVRLMRSLLLGDALSPASRDMLLRWMIACETGRARLRAGAPRRWLAGDKTGNGARGAANDLAILWPPGRAPILIACYMDGADVRPGDRDMVHQAVGALVARQFA